MERGLLWLPLLLFFSGLAWTGWREYQKVEAYQRWAQAFDCAKYDIYAVLGQKGKLLTWGKPFSREPSTLDTFSLDDVTAIQLWVNGQPLSGENPPSKGKPSLIFQLSEAKSPIEIPFTEIPLAFKWLNYLQQLKASS